MTNQPQVDAEFYEADSFHPLRIESITEQIRLLSYHQCSQVLEIGVGKGLLGHFLGNFPHLRHCGLDIAADLRPHVVGSVLRMPFSDRQFEAVVCCQVLEHLKFEDFLPALREIRRVSRKLVILSLPDQRRRIGLGVCLFRKGWFRTEWGLPGSRSGREGMCPRHFWEIGHTRQTSLKAVQQHISEAGFTLEERHRLDVHAWHHFFLLRP
jgi:hypothetical protein